MSAEKDFRFEVGQSRIIWLIPCTVTAFIAVLIAVGPFFWQAKLLFFIAAILLAIYYWYQFSSKCSFSQLRYANGVLLLVFNDGQEPELIQLVGPQRILPWLVELNFKRENGKRVCWGIASDAMDKDNFRELKVFMQTHHQVILNRASQGE